MGYYNCLMLLLSSAECSSFVNRMPNKLQKGFWLCYWVLAAGFKILGG